METELSAGWLWVPRRTGKPGDPIFGKKDPIFGKKDPIFGKEDPVFGKGDPIDLRGAEMPS